MPGAETLKISGNFLSKVFERSYRNMGKWVKEMKAHFEPKGKEMKKLYFFYTTYPKCAKYYGTDYTVLLAKV